MNHLNTTSACRCPHHLVQPILIILFGGSFLAGNMGYLGADIIRIVWPTLIILIGVAKLFAGSCKCFERGS
ncbi:MAG: hypothetical protein AB202_01990 [Parcubacteria bacterium C7867-007]|nr:MAG: hypothetical protein AB202_01990 [Parcubacteria bacterium C7867-007]